MKHFILVPILLSFLFIQTGCNRDDYDCSCIYSGPGVSGSDTQTYLWAREKRAKKSCEDHERNLQSEYPDADVECTLSN